VIVSPRFHRWLHADEDAARDKNFPGLLPIWDVLFGTYYMPRDLRARCVRNAYTSAANADGSIAVPIPEAPRNAHIFLIRTIFHRTIAVL
jgi:hypothetical protein